MDGIVLGVLFADKDSSAIISTTIAIFAHEIPQEVGDVGILMHSRFTAW